MSSDLKGGQVFPKTQEITDISTCNIGQILSNRKPLIFKNINADSPLLERASGTALLDKLSSTIGSRIISAMSGFYEDRGLLSYSDATINSVTRNTLSGPCQFEKFARQVVEMSTHSERGYLYCQLLDLDETAPELIPLIDHLCSRLSVDRKRATWNMWFGSGNHHVNTHYDKVENFYFVLQGKKIFQLFPPDTLPDLYSGPYEGGPSGVPESIVDSTNAEIKKYPGFSRALQNSQLAEVSVGDMLYLPSNWWHNVKSQGLNISANLWWSDISNVQRLRAELSFLHLLYSVKTLPLHWRDYWRVNVEHYVFSRNGDPFSHLPRDKQGIAGDGGTNVQLEIRKRIVDMEQHISQLELNIDLSDSRLRLQCAGDLNIKLETGDQIELRLGTKKVLTDNYDILAILMAFVEARNPVEVYTGKVAQTYDTDAFAKKLVELIRYGVLVISHISQAASAEQRHHD